MTQVTGLLFLLQNSQGFNTIFISLNEFAHRLEPKYLPFASKKNSLKKQFSLELYNCIFHSVLNMQHGPWRSCYGQEIQLLNNWLYKTIKNLK